MNEVSLDEVFDIVPKDLSCCKRLERPFEGINARINHLISEDKFKGSLYEDFVNKYVFPSIIKRFGEIPNELMPRCMKLKIASFSLLNQLKTIYQKARSESDQFDQNSSCIADAQDFMSLNSFNLEELMNEKGSYYYLSDTIKNWPYYTDSASRGIAALNAQNTMNKVTHVLNNLGNYEKAMGQLLELKIKQFQDKPIRRNDMAEYFILHKAVDLLENKDVKLKFDELVTKNLTYLNQQLINTIDIYECAKNFDNHLETSEQDLDELSNIVEDFSIATSN